MFDEDRDAVVVNDVAFSPAALSELQRVDIIPSPHEDETSLLKVAIKERLRAHPDSEHVFLEVSEHRLVVHCTVDGQTAYVSDIEVRN